MRQVAVWLDRVISQPGDGDRGEGLGEVRELTRKFPAPGISRQAGSNRQSDTIRPGCDHGKHEKQSLVRSGAWRLGGLLAVGALATWCSERARRGRSSSSTRPR